MTTRRATPGDAPSMARIYNDGIEDRVATSRPGFDPLTISANGSTPSIPLW